MPGKEAVDAEGGDVPGRGDVLALPRPLPSLATSPCFPRKEAADAEEGDRAEESGLDAPKDSTEWAAGDEDGEEARLDGAGIDGCSADARRRERCAEGSCAADGCAPASLLRL